MRKSVQKLQSRKKHGLQEHGVNADVPLPCVRTPAPNSLDLGRGNTRCSKVAPPTCIEWPLREGEGRMAFNLLRNQK